MVLVLGIELTYGRLYWSYWHPTELEAISWLWHLNVSLHNWEKIKNRAIVCAGSGVRDGIDN